MTRTNGLNTFGALLDQMLEGVDGVGVTNHARARCSMSRMIARGLVFAVMASLLAPACGRKPGSSGTDGSDVSSMSRRAAREARGSWP